MKELRARKEALEASGTPEDLAEAKKLYAEEKAMIGESFYGLSAGAAEVVGMDIRVSGAENLPPDDQPFCIIASHQGYMDVLAIGYALGGRQISYIAKEALKKAPLIGPYIVDIRGIFIPTEESPRAHVAVIN